VCCRYRRRSKMNEICVKKWTARSAQEYYALIGGAVPFTNGRK
jgi:hypothetical protein